MSVTFPIDLPTTPGMIRSTFIPVSNAKSTVSPLSQKLKALSFDGDHWRLNFVLPLMDRVQAAPWQADLTALRGPLGTFTWYDRFQSSIQGSNAGTALIAGANQTGTELLVDGLTFSATDVFKKGDKIQLPVTANHDELKMVTQDVDADGAGLATIPIWPPITNSPTNNAAIIVDNAEGVFILSADVPLDVSGLGNYELSVSAREAI